LTVVGAVVYNSYGARLFTTHADHHMPVNTLKRTEQIVRTGKSEAEVTNNTRLRPTCFSFEANY